MDRRPYAEVQILCRAGGNLANQIIKQRMTFKRVATTVNTADGQQQKVVGRLKTPIQYKGKVQELDLYIIPSLSQDLYLGIDFWTNFELLPPEMSINELRHASSNEDSNSV